MNLVDSSAWLEYLVGGPNAKHYLAPLRDRESLLVPVIVIYEVLKVVLRERGEAEALKVQGALQQGTVVDIDATLAVAASRLSLRHNLPMADSLILAVADAHEATLWTQDVHFKSLPRVRYFAKR